MSYTLNLDVPATTKNKRKEFEMDAEQVKQFQKAVGTAHWKLGLEKFAEAIGSDPSHDHAQAKFQDFNHLSRALNRFDPETLAKVIAAGAAQ